MPAAPSSPPAGARAAPSCRPDRPRRSSAVTDRDPITVLPAAHRMRRGDDFTATTRGGRRVKAGSVVVHQLTVSDAAGPALVGFVVGKAVGNSVVRHRVARKLRAQTSLVLSDLPAGSRTVVRALPDAATASSVALSNDLASARRRLERSAR